jgi:DNA-binding NtrC family response regulator
MPILGLDGGQGSYPGILLRLIFSRHFYTFLKLGMIMGEEAMNLQQILIADDDPEISEIIRRGLTIAGYQIVEATDGRDALRVLRKNPEVRLIVSDIRMPIMSGVELLELLHKNRPEIPILLISGDPRFLNNNHVLNEIATVIPKPLCLAKLVEKVKEALDKTQLSTQNKTG